VEPRVAVIVPCYSARGWLSEALASLQEREPLELVVVDDASPDAATRAVLEQVAADGVRVIRREHNGGPALARNSGLEATTAPFVFPLDADDLALPGRISAAADRLEAVPEAVACVGDYAEFGRSHYVRAVPHALDPYRVAFTNEYPVTALFRRSALERVGGWHDPLPAHPGYEDWNLWMDFAQEAAIVVHVGGTLYRRRVHGVGVDASARHRHAELYEGLRRRHPALFAGLRAHRRRSDLSRPRRILYPLVYGDRRLTAGARALKPLLDRAGVWTLRR
jgi:glycosyltransferase involved in cell wall biosynthesis